MTGVIEPSDEYQHSYYWQYVHSFFKSIITMKKVLALFDGEHFSMGAFNFARQLNEAQPILLTGVFLPSLDYTKISMYYLGGMVGPLYAPGVEAEPGIIDRNIQQFKDLCVKHGIECRVHSVIDGPILESIAKETRYADVLLLSSELFYSNFGEASQKEYLEDTMHNAECPVIVVPEHYNFPQSIIMAYDGSKASVFAIKQFAYLFPELSGTSTLIVYASEKENEFPDLSYIEEFAARHFQDLSFFKLDAEARKYFNTWVTDKGSPLLVTGAYSRSFLSGFFKKSFAAEVIAEHKLPVFIAHT